MRSPGLGRSLLEATVVVVITAAAALESGRFTPESVIPGPETYRLPESNVKSFFIRVVQETRHWHEDTGLTTSGRSKEQAEDYRYFPEPDLVPVAPSPDWLEDLRSSLPEQPSVHRRRVQADWGMTDLEMRDVVNAGAVAVVESTVAAGASPAAAKKWWLGEIARRANEAGLELEDAGIGPDEVARVQELVDDGFFRARRILSNNESLLREFAATLLKRDELPVGERVFSAKATAAVRRPMPMPSRPMWRIRSNPPAPAAGD